MHAVFVEVNFKSMILKTNTFTVYILIFVLCACDFYCFWYTVKNY